MIFKDFEAKHGGYEAFQTLFLLAERSLLKL